VTDLLELRALHCLVRHGSWAKAAKELGMSRVRLQKVLSNLEQRLGVSLLGPSPSVVLTDEGLAFYKRTTAALDALTNAEATLLRHTPTPNGKVRVTAPVVLGLAYVAPAIGRLRQRYPELALELSLTDRFVDLRDENFDLAIRAGAPFDARLSARPLCTNRRVLVASPSYVETRGAPQTPDDLTQHECILFTPFTNQGEWKLQGPRGTVAVQVSGQLATNNGYALNNFAEQGLGITLGATLSLAPALLAGRLVRILPEYELERTQIFAAYPATSEPPIGVSAVIEFFAREFCDPPVWDRQLADKVPGF
jgi:DNA-binding transcriptional LysR family regulator